MFYSFSQYWGPHLLNHFRRHVKKRESAGFLFLASQIPAILKSFQISKTNGSLTNSI